MKARGVLTHSHYLWSHEACFYGWREGQPPSRKPPSNERTVWELDQQGSSMNIHPTQKPLELFLRPIKFHTEPGDICYEPFLGSGTQLQLIAAEKLGRTSHALEREPQYVDVAVRCCAGRPFPERKRFWGSKGDGHYGTDTVAR